MREGIEATGNHGPNVVQSSITKQHAIETLEHTQHFMHIIKIQTSQIITLNERILMFQK